MVEALAVGTPVIATEVGGVAEVVRDGVNGLLVPARRRRRARRRGRRFFGDAHCASGCAGAAAASVGAYAPERVFGGSRRRSAGRGAREAARPVRRRGASSFRSPPSLAAQVGRARRGARLPRARAAADGARRRASVSRATLPALDGPAFYAALPAARSRASCATSVPHAVLAQGAHETARRAARAQARARRHGGRSPTCTATGARRPGSTAPALRELLNPVADRVALGGAAQRGRHPHGHGLHDAARPRARARAGGRVPGVHGLRLVPAGGRRSRCRERPQALFVGVLERYKNVDGLAEAWRLAAPRCRTRGCGSSARARCDPSSSSSSRDLPEQTSWSAAADAAARCRRRSTSRRCSCCRRARRGWAA